MSSGVVPARVVLDVWRDQHADRLNPMRFHVMEALERRASEHDGEVRRILDERLSRLLESYADDLEKADVRSSAPPRAHARETLGSLVEHIASATKTGGTTGGIELQVAPFPELGALDTFRKIWSRLHGESQLRQALDHVPTNAGPLNSSALVHRSITLMRNLSPAYLQQFLSYVDTLSWMEQVSDSITQAAKEARRTVNSRKRARN